MRVSDVAGRSALGTSTSEGFWTLRLSNVHPPCSSTIFTHFSPKFPSMFQNWMCDPNWIPFSKPTQPRPILEKSETRPGARYLPLRCRLGRSCRLACLWRFWMVLGIVGSVSPPLNRREVSFGNQGWIPCGSGHSFSNGAMFCPSRRFTRRQSVMWKEKLLGVCNDLIPPGLNLHQGPCRCFIFYDFGGT